MLRDEPDIYFQEYELTSSQRSFLGRITNLSLAEQICCGFSVEAERYKAIGTFPLREMD